MYAHAIPANDHDASQVMGNLTHTGSEVRAKLVTIEQYEAQTKRRKLRAAARKPRAQKAST